MSTMIRTVQKGYLRLLFAVKQKSPNHSFTKINNLFEQLTNTQTPTKVQEYINSYENSKTNFMANAKNTTKPGKS